MDKKRVLLIGDLPLGTEILKLFLDDNSKTEVVGVLCQKKNTIFKNDPFDDSRSLYQAAKDHKIPTYTALEDVIKDFSSVKIDIGISCRASIIYKKSFIDIFKQYFINLHGGLLPARSGVNIACHCILEGDSQSGGTLHIINEQIDAGDIIDRKSFSITEEDTAFDVYQKTQICLLDLVKRNLFGIIKGTLVLTPQIDLIERGEERKYFYRRDLQPYKSINHSNVDWKKLPQIVRGLDFPNHEPAYFEINGKKFYLTTRKFFENE